MGEDNGNTCRELTVGQKGIREEREEEIVEGRLGSVTLGSHSETSLHQSISKQRPIVLYSVT